MTEVEERRSPAERYARSKSVQQSPMTVKFESQRDFQLDDFQLESCHELERGNNVLVAAPTGAGKTVVAEFAVFLAMNTTSQKLFYTTPIKALSNQKFHELAEEWGSEQVGLLTGDTSINSEARIVVMTTEVLRNMIYAQSRTLDDLGFVVLDEVHYLADKFRGAVWEEVLIHLPRPIRTISLSATVSNAEEFGDWLQTVRGSTEVIVSEHRPVPLDQHVLIRDNLIPLFDESGRGSSHAVNPELLALVHSRTTRQNVSRTSQRARQRGASFTRHESQRMYREDIVDLLAQHNLLPAIFFVFSRAGCDQAVEQIIRSGIRLNSKAERSQVRQLIDSRCSALPAEDLAALEFDRWCESVSRGVAAHHAGMLPLFKEIIEELFQQRLVKVVFATETLALGVNMPARTVVLEKLEKFNGEARVPLSPGEYTQLTGRAGRRGIDVEGHSVIQWHPNLNPQFVAGLASKRTYPMYSSFKPTYNMAINLVQRYGRDRARELLETSFAQFQADRTVVGLTQRVRQQQATLDGYSESMACHLGNFTEYAELRHQLSEAEKTRKSTSQRTAEANSRQKNISSLRKHLERHPCHACADREQHARWGERWWKLQRDTQRLVNDIQSRTGAISRLFDRLCDVLVELGYLTDSDGSLTITPEGEILAGIYGDRDLLVSECIRGDLWSELSPAALAAMVCALVFEPRREESEFSMRQLPPGAFREAFEDTLFCLSQLVQVEENHHVTVSAGLSPSLSRAMYQWASGDSLDNVLFDADMPVGDFVRWAKQTIDLLDQISKTDSSVSRIAASAIGLIQRGIVDYAGQLQ